MRQLPWSKHSFSQVWMRFDSPGLSNGHSISPCRFSYAKLNKQLRGSEQFIKDSLESTALTVWEPKSGAVNSHFKSSSFKDFDLIKLRRWETCDILQKKKRKKGEITRRGIISLLSECMTFHSASNRVNPIYVNGWLLFRNNKRLKNTMEAPGGDWLMVTVGAPPRLGVNVFLSVSRVWMTEMLANEY